MAGVGACARDGVLICSANQLGLTCDAIAGQPEAEACDGIDNDCDGQVDNGATVACYGGPPGTLDVGQCAGGTRPCNAGGDPVPACEGQVLPAAEACDGLDNDCDGAVDEGTCLPANVLLCGTSDRNIGSFFAAADGLNFVSGCVPDSETRAVFVTRSATELLEGPAWAAFIGAGGNLITEYGMSAPVASAVTGTVVAAGTPNGGCHDQVLPGVRLNEADSFWRSLAAVPVPEELGCGFDMSGWALPGLVPLGGWTAATVSLAYLPLGQGRLWLVEADWQDGEPVEPEAGLVGMNRAMRAMALWPDVDVGARVEVGSFSVDDGPDWSLPTTRTYSCVAACALLFGGDAADYGCSTEAGVYNGRAYGSQWGLGGTCEGEGVAEDFVLPAEGAVYDCGEAGCSHSAYVADNCVGIDAINHCWR